MGLMMQQPQGYGGGMFTGPQGMFTSGSAANQGLLNFGLGTLQANSQGAGAGRAALAGLGSGAGAYIGAKQNINQKGERDQLMQALMGRMGGVANRAPSIGGPPPGAPTDGPNPNSVIGGMFSGGQPQMQGRIGGGGGGIAGGGMPQGPRGLGMFQQQQAMGNPMFRPRPGMGGMY
jgi:hypothetical protein